jgi:hypothetical protein
MKPPSPDAEALRPQQPAPVRTANGFFVAADKPRHLARGQQPVGQALRVVRVIANELIVDPNGLRIWVQVPHGLLRGIHADRHPPATPARRRPTNWGRCTTVVTTPMLLGKRAGRPRGE